MMMLACCCSNEHSNFINKWTRIGEVSQLICYPLKTGGPIYLSQIDYSSFGSEKNKLRDCMFMIEEYGCFTSSVITAESYPRIVKIQPTYVDGNIILSAPGMIDIAINISELEQSPIIQCDAWGREVGGISCGYPISHWISKYLQKIDDKYHLNYYPSPMRIREGSENIPGYKKWPEKCPVLRVINESSIADLNEKLTGIQTKPLQFRPNIVIKGPPAFQEDNWRCVKFGDNFVLGQITPWKRYRFTNIDSDTGDFNRDDEPLRTLIKYRKIETLKDTTGPVMGVYGEIKATGIIRVGDPVYIPAYD